jgi:Mitochondrial carrier protein
MGDELPLVLSFLGGSLSSCTAEFFTFPMDQLKTKMQLGGTQGSIKYTGPFHAIKDNFNRGGLKGFYWGIAPAMYRQFMFSGIRISIYDKSKYYLGLDHNNGGVLERFMIAAVGGGLSSFICTPLDVCKIRIVNDPYRYKYNGLIDCIQKIWTHEGIFNGFYRGSSPNICRAIVVNATELGTYDNSKNLLISAFAFSEQSIMLRFLASVAAGFFSALASSPIDVVKTRYMNYTKVDPKSLKGDELRFTGPFDCLKKIVAHEGFGALYNGFWFLWLRLGPWCTIMFLSWDAYKDYVGKQYNINKIKKLIKD